MCSVFLSLEFMLIKDCLGVGGCCYADSLNVFGVFVSPSFPVMIVYMVVQVLKCSCVVLF